MIEKKKKSEMDDKKLHFRHLLLFFFRQKTSAVYAHQQLVKVYGKQALSTRQCQFWFKKFRNGNFALVDAPRSGRPSLADDDQIKALVDANPYFTTRDIETIE